MTLATDIDFVCPACKHSAMIHLQQTVNVNMHPELLKRLTLLELTTHNCGGCSLPVVLKGLLYHDPRRRLMVSFQDPANMPVPDGPPGYIYRSVNTDMMLIEKVEIANADMDDRAVEIVKFWLCNSSIESHADFLMKFADGSINAALLAYRGLAQSSGAPNRACLRFVYLLHTPNMFPLTIEVDLAWYTAALALLEALSNPVGMSPAWHVVDIAWAQAIPGVNAASQPGTMDVFIDALGLMRDATAIRFNERWQAQLKWQATRVTAYK